MDNKEQNRKNSYLNPHQICSLYKLSHIQLDVILKNLKDKIDQQFEEFRVNLVSSLNNLNFIRYSITYPSDDFSFIYKQKVNVSKVQSRLQQKQQIMRRMSDFSIIKHDVGGISDNCTWELEKKVLSVQKILSFENICPSGVTFLQKNAEIIKQYLQFWRVSESSQLNMGSIFKQISPVFAKDQIKKIGVIFSQINKRLVDAKLLFRASQNNFQSALFKQSCQGQGPTLMIAKSDKGFIFGGYTPAKWLNTKQKQYVGDPTGTSFLFSLQNNMVFPIKKNQLEYAISAYGGWGPIYGSPYGPDLSISDKCHMNENSCSSLGSHYDIPVSIKQYSQEAFCLLAGAKKFKIIEYEIYKVLLQ